MEPKKIIQMLPGGCHLEMVAQNPLCTVGLCACGNLHVTLGALTLRFDPAACEAVWSALGEALAHLEPQVMSDALHLPSLRPRIRGAAS